MSAPASPRRLLAEPTEAGEQTLVPGIAPLTLRERLQARAAAPLEARRPQRPPDIGLFDPLARRQLELFGPGGAPRAAPAPSGKPGPLPPARRMTRAPVRRAHSAPPAPGSAGTAEPDTQPNADSSAKE